MKLNCKRIDFTYTPGEEIFTFPDESGLPFLFDVEKELTADPMKEKHLWMKATVWSNGRRMLWLLLSSCPCRKSKEVFTVCVQAGAMSSWLRKWLRSSKSPSRPCVFGWKHAISYKFGTASPPPERGAQPHQCSQALLYAFCSQFSEHGRRRMA